MNKPQAVFGLAILHKPVETAVIRVNINGAILDIKTERANCDTLWKLKGDESGKLIGVRMIAIDGETLREQRETIHRKVDEYFDKAEKIKKEHWDK